MFKIGDIVKHRLIVSINGEDPGTHVVRWVSTDGVTIQIDFGDDEILLCAASSYILFN
tara:strand:- start:14112 stop:14285 length:174 start_codon:yes stop_codon:yes gene_type:complete